MSEHDWVWTNDAARELGGALANPHELRRLCGLLGIALGPLPGDARKKAIHREDLALLVEARDRARANRARRAGRCN